MFSDIPYFKDNTIKNIRVDSNYYIIEKYANKNKTYLEYRSLLSSDISDIEAEYYSVLKEYLEKKNIDYKIKVSRYNMIHKVRRNKIILALSLIGFIIPIIGIIFKFKPFIFMGVATVSFGGIALTYAYENLCKYKKHSKEQSFCDEYERLTRVYDNHLNRGKKTNTIQNIKPMERRESFVKHKILFRKK